MKKKGEYTCRGRVIEGDEVRIQLFDGSFETAYKVISFDIWSADLGSSGNDCAGRLSVNSIGAMPTSGTMMDARDANQIAWAAVQAGTNGFGPISSIVDPDNLVIEDLWFSGQHGGTSKEINYLITMEKYDISETMGAVTMSRKQAKRSD